MLFTTMPVCSCAMPLLPASMEQIILFTITRPEIVTRRARQIKSKIIDRRHLLLHPIEIRCLYRVKKPRTRPYAWRRARIACFMGIPFLTRQPYPRQNQSVPTVERWFEPVFYVCREL